MLTKFILIMFIVSGLIGYILVKTLILFEEALDFILSIPKRLLRLIKKQICKRKMKKEETDNG